MVRYDNQLEVEINDLRQKINKITCFLESDKLESVDKVQIQLMQYQKFYMNLLLEILIERHELLVK